MIMNKEMVVREVIFIGICMWMQAGHRLKMLTHFTARANTNVQYVETEIKVACLKWWQPQPGNRKELVCPIFCLPINRLKAVSMWQRRTKGRWRWILEEKRRSSNENCTKNHVCWNVVICWQSNIHSRIIYSSEVAEILGTCLSHFIATSAPNCC